MVEMFQLYSYWVWDCPALNGMMTILIYFMFMNSLIPFTIIESHITDLEVKV